MKNKIAIAFILSLIVHISIVGALCLKLTNKDRAVGEGEYFVMIDISPIPEKASQSNILKSDMKDPTSTKTSKSSNKQISSPYKKQTALLGSKGNNKILTKIKTKIERAKKYPKLARRMGIQGRPSVEFEINADGSLKYVKIRRSSGEDILDNAAVDAVTNAAPLPFHKDPIQLAIRYELR